MKQGYIVGVFDSKESLIEGLHTIKDANLKVDEIYTPYPVEEAIEFLGEKTRFTKVAFLYGALAVISVMSFLYYTSVIDWPLHYGGKPAASFPSFIIITLVLTILSVTLLSLFTFSIRAKVYPGKDYFLPDTRSTDDKFVVLFGQQNAGGDFSAVEKALKAGGASEVYKKEI